MPSVVTAQTDFSAGELDVTAKRDGENPIVKAGARQMANWRILNTKKVTNRPGRRAMFIETGRVDEVLMAPGVIFYLCFGQNTLHVRDAAGAIVFNLPGMNWTTATAKTIVWAVYDKSIYITFGSLRPNILTWDGASTWTLANFGPSTTPGGQKQTIFYRLAPKGITLTLNSRIVGAAIATWSAAVLTASHVGTRFRYIGRQFTIGSVIGPTSANVFINQTMPMSESVIFGSDPTLVFTVGDIVQGALSGARGIIIAVVNPAIFVQLLNVTSAGSNAGGAGPNFGGGSGAEQVSGFIVGETVVGAGGSLVSTGLSGTGSNPQSVTFWDEEVMTDFRGWPNSVFVDQGRLCFCNFPGLPAGIAWSEFGVFDNFYVGAAETDPIFEIVPDKAQVLFGVPGIESSEFIFCDNALWYIPISVTNPLRPGSVQFIKLNSDGCANVQPRAAQEFIAYVNASGNAIMAVMPLGAQTRPYTTRALTELHSHLFGTITALAIPTTSGAFPERYMYALNSAGTVVIGKLTTKEGRIDIDTVIGWAPWSGGGTVSWIFARSANLLLTTSYAPGGAAAVSICEVLDADYYLDGAVLVNSLPAAMPAPVGKGPLWWIPNGTVDLMDQATRMMGTYTIDANGFIVPQGNGGEDLTRVTLVAGQPWTAALEPFIPPVQAGQDVEQRMWKRRILRFQAYVQRSTGFVLQRLYSDQSGPNLPAAGAVMKERRILTWNQGEDATLPPTLREQSYLDRPIGLSHDPREAIVKDTPGPLTVLEISTEVTV